jgi:hypothetical protein
VDEVQVNRKIDTPLGWGSDANSIDWIAYEVDLANHDQIEIFVGDSKTPAIRRAISVHKKPTVDENHLVDGVFTIDQMPVHSKLPTVFVPAQHGSGEKWTYEVKDAERRLVYVEEIVPNSGLLNPATPTNLDGTYNITVSKGFGTSLRLTCAIVSQLELQSEAGTRQLLDNGSGLAKTSMILTRSGQSHTAFFSTGERAKELLDSRLSEQRLILRPKHEKLELLNTSSLKNSEWITPTKTHVDDLKNLQLIATVQNPGLTQLVAVWPDNSKVIINPKTSALSARFNLSEFSETAKQNGAFELFLISPSGRKLAAGNSYPKKMFEDFEYLAERSEVSFAFRGDLVPAGLEVCFYANRAPWLPQQIVPLSGPAVAVPDSLKGFGEIAFTVAISNPWTISNFSEIPDRDSPNSGRFNPGAPDDTLSPDHALAGWLTTGTPNELMKSISIERAWQCMLLGNIQSGAVVSRKSVRDFAAEVLLTQPQTALVNYPAGLRADENYLKHLFTTGLVSQHAVVSNRELTAFASKPFLACLLASSEGAKVSEAIFEIASSFWGLKPTKNLEESETWSDSKSESILLEKSALFDKMPMIFSHFDDEQLLGWLNAYIPGSLFEGGTMAQIVNHLAFGAEKAADLIAANELASAIQDLQAYESQMGSSYQALAETRPFASDALREQVRLTRGLRIRTMDIPAASIRLALLARQTARDKKLATELWDKHKFLFKQISTALPAMAELDLTLTELYLQLTEGTSNE